MRYASLHRSVESGLATDRTWSELIEICLELGFKDEAVGAFWQLKEGSVRRRALVQLQRQQLLLEVTLGNAETGVGHPGDRRRVDGEALVDRLLDGFRFLFSDHMPLTAIVATVTFPIVVGLGGFLTSSVQDSLLLPLLALIPALSVVGLVGALGRRILVEAAQGLDDPPEIPALRDLTREAGRFLVDATVLGAIFLGPGVVLTQVVDHVGWSGALAALGVGLVLLPMAMALRQTRDDWTCLKPSVLFRGIVRGGLDYMAIAGLSTALFAPSLTSIWFTSGSHLYLVISVVGPLAVVPTFVVSRLLGQFLFAKRKALAAVPAPVAAPAPVAHKPLSTRPSTPRPALRRPSHPEARAAAPAAAQAPAPARATAPAPARVSAPAPARAPARSATPAPATGAARPAAAARRRAAARPPAEPHPAPASIGATAGLPKPRLRPRDDAAPRSRVLGEDIPDLTKMPGVAVLKGEARVNAGAAAPTRPR